MSPRDIASALADPATTSAPTVSPEPHISSQTASKSNFPSEARHKGWDRDPKPAPAITKHLRIIRKDYSAPRHSNIRPHPYEIDRGLRSIDAERCARLLYEIILLALGDSVGSNELEVGRARRFLKIQTLQSIDIFSAVGIDLENWKLETLPLLLRAWAFHDNNPTRSRNIMRGGTRLKTLHTSTGFIRLMDYLRSHPEDT